MKTLTSTLAALTLTAVLGGFGAIGATTEAAAATEVKPMLSVSGKTYYKKGTAKSSAVGRWEKKAVIKHGMKFGNWEDAKKTSFDCNSKFHQGNGKKQWTCKANGKPIAKVQMCASGNINAFWYHPTEAVAKASVRDTWEKLAAEKYGVKYSFYKNAKNKHSTCGTNSKYPGNITCTLKATPCK